MLSNKEIKRKEIFKKTQELIKVTRDFKKAQSDLLLALNDCAQAEVCHYNKLQKGVVELRFKGAVKHYFRVYGQKMIIEEHIQELKNWKAED